MRPTARRPKTGFDTFFESQMADPEFAAAYTEARAEIDGVDGLVRALDEARVAVGLSKAELARRIDAKPEVVRRLFTTDAPNPTMATVVKLATVLGLRFELVPHGPRKAMHRRPAARRAAT
jgi:hypothetical protein